MKIIVTFSGGKDSLADLLWVRNNIKNIQAIYKPKRIFVMDGRELLSMPKI